MIFQTGDLYDAAKQIFLYRQYSEWTAKEIIEKGYIKGSGDLKKLKYRGYIEKVARRTAQTHYSIWRLVKKPEEFWLR